MSSADQGELAGSISHPDTPYDGARHGYNLSNTTDTDGDDVAGMEDGWPRDSSRYRDSDGDGCGDNSLGSLTTQ